MKYIYNILKARIITQWHSCTLLTVDSVRIKILHKSNFFIMFFLFFFPYISWVSTKCGKKHLLLFITHEVKNVNNRTVCKHFVIFLVVYLISHVYVLSVLMQLETWNVCLFLYEPFCYGALKLDISTLFTTFFFAHLLNLYNTISKIYNLKQMCVLVFYSC